MKYRELNAHMDNNCAPKASDKPAAPSSKSQKDQWSNILGSKSKGKAKEKYALDIFGSAIF